ncbi:MAG: flagellar hook-associated family protein [Alphaproteobacteria bacterium]|nr:flagellar hook-associated family protein [Alphaproteobacteria bacterium]
MKTTFISTQSIGAATRNAIVRSQERLAEAQSELSTGRHFDTGLALGAGTANLVDLRQQNERLAGLESSNARLQFRAGVAQAALGSLVDGAQEFLEELIAARQAPSGGKLVQASAEGRLTAMIDQLNVTADGDFVFSGMNAAEPPFDDYWSDPPPASRSSVSAAFLGEFGLSQDDPGVAAITPAGIEAFLDGSFANLFADPAWSNDWSTATSELAVVRISRSEAITTSLSANEGAIRKLARVYSAAADLGTENMSQATFQALVDKLVTVTGEAVNELGAMQSKLGLNEQRLADASERARLQRNLLQERIGTLESVDPFEASTRVTSLLTVIETSYAVTARIQRLSILNYL